MRQREKRHFNSVKYRHVRYKSSERLERYRRRLSSSFSLPLQFSCFGGRERRPKHHQQPTRHGQSQGSGALKLGDHVLALAERDVVTGIIPKGRQHFGVRAHHFCDFPTSARLQDVKRRRRRRGKVRFQRRYVSEAFESKLAEPVILLLMYDGHHSLPTE
jgi:hypothetical protein